MMFKYYESREIKKKFRLEYFKSRYRMTSKFDIDNSKIFKSGRAIQQVS